MTNTKYGDPWVLVKVILCILLLYVLLAIGCLIPDTVTDDRQEHKRIMMEKFKAFAEERE